MFTIVAVIIYVINEFILYTVQHFSCEFSVVYIIFMFIMMYFFRCELIVCFCFYTK